MEENDIDYTLHYFHGHCSFRVLVETFKFADKIGELRILLRDWKTHFALVISEHRLKYPAMLYKKFTRLLELAENGAMFEHGTNEVLSMLDEAAKEDETEEAPRQPISAGSRDTSLVPVSKIQYDINSAISSCG